MVQQGKVIDAVVVSTHSRLKAAGRDMFDGLKAYHGFNTQPPEGGWSAKKSRFTLVSMFQHTAA